MLCMKYNKNKRLSIYNHKEKPKAPENLIQWQNRMLAECGHNPNDVVTMGFEEFNKKFNLR